MDKIFSNVGMPKNLWHGPMQTFIHFDPEHPEELEVYCTKDDKWNGPRKLHTFRFLNVLPYFQHVFEEENLQPDMTVGSTEPLVCVTNDGDSYVVVQYKQRHNGMVWEVFRKRWGSVDEGPKLLVNGGTLKEYTDVDLGRNLLNNARIVARGGKLAQVASCLTVLADVETPPALDTGQWMDMEKFMLLTLDGPGKDVIGVAIYRGFVPAANKEKLARYSVELPAFIAEMSQ